MARDAGTDFASPGTGGDDIVPGSGQGVYSISIAAELTGAEQHTLRAWERAGLLTPDRSTGGTRRYSAEDLKRVRHLGELSDAGINLPGIARVLDLEQQLDQALAEVDRLTRQLPD